jgi:thiol:disulfide interchange protein DsbD
VPAIPDLLLRRLAAGLAGLLFVLVGPAQGAQEFLAPEQAFHLEVEKSAPDEVRLHWSIAPGYYLYRDRLVATASPSGTRLDAVLPPGIRKNDPNFGVLEVYHDGVTMKVAPGSATAVDVTWQGCAEAGLCYPPQKQTIQVATVGGTTAPVAVAPPADAGVSGLLAGTAGSDRRITQLLGEHSLGWTLPLFFLLGIALAFTPCVLPMLPIVSGVVVGSQATPRRAFALSMAFVLPMALTYSALGVAAALAGANLQAMLQNRWTMLGLGAVYVALALGMFGFFTLQLPARLRERLDGASRRQQGGTLAGAAAMGVLSALLVGPCMTAPLAGALLYIAQSGNVVVGALLLLALGLGMGAPLVLAGTLGARFLPRPGVWMERVKGLVGFVLLGTAVWMFERVVPEPLALLLWGALALAVSVTLVHLSSRGSTDIGGTRPRLVLATRTLAIVAGLWGGAMVLGAAGGASDPWRPLAYAAAPEIATSPQPTTLRFEPVASEQELQARLGAARASGQPALLDFYADWCVSCKAIDKEVFGAPSVQQALAGVVLLRADVTDNDARHRELMQANQVIGPPTVMLFDAAGHERRDARLVGEFTADQLLQRQPAGVPVRP